jgi:hypothetical protein
VAVWADTYFSGSYREAIDLTLISAGLDPNDAILLTRQARTKYGYYLNLQQEVSDDLGLFADDLFDFGKHDGLAVNSRGNGTTDSVYAPTASRQRVVTERLAPGRTATMTWVPERAGNWLFHCHFAEHVTPHGALAGENSAAGS